ncbi:MULTISPECIES: endolytic transglycosylase MltG [Nitrosomonas]|uniref:Endolytic murein transglycosylase n=1 Tax=Nitrosomonas communis TaxID=44574 RepID=A0A0F7KD81_9PROT|nr:MULTISPECIES: endolytic transglycosylase MltG [Nitrosomonas]AKH37501.1 aminodeoxychorismate lyase [Nitrosomonas communis]TYP92335.1 UPF0755 protein [Nitrosomonas communis]UVS62749.1 endolytic transglycosylase MltG [Nitrosomonas sp. PLL12]
MWVLKRLSRKLKLLFLSIFIGIIFFIGWFYYLANAATQLPFIPYEFSIESGSNLKDISNQLVADHLLPNAWSFILLSKMLGYESLIKAGEYVLIEDASPLQLLEYLVKGDIRQNEIRFIEGWTFSELRKALDEHPAIRHDTLNLGEQEILQLIGASELKAEGLFFPDTYFFPRNSNDVSILKRAYHTMQNHLKIAWSSRKESLPLKSEYEGLILASIIEKETGKKSDRSMIAGVLINRLRLGMKLQVDPTVIYGIGQDFDGNLRKQDLLTDQEYNTYMRSGLPPSPIAMPGLASIQAAFNPAETDALYFVAKGNGESHFSTNLKDHNRAVHKYQKQ